MLVPKSVDKTDFKLTSSVGYGMGDAAIAAVGGFGGCYHAAVTVRQHVTAVK